MIQFAKKISWAEPKLVWIVGRTSQRPDCGLGKSVGMLGKSLLGLAFDSKLLVAILCRRNGFQHRWRKDFAEDVGRGPPPPLLGSRLALPGPVGRGASTHVMQLLERSGGIWATQRAFLLPHQEGASGSLDGSPVKAFCLCGNAHG